MLVAKKKIGTNKLWIRLVDETWMIKRAASSPTGICCRMMGRWMRRSGLVWPGDYVELLDIIIVVHCQVAAERILVCVMETLVV